MAINDGAMSIGDAVEKYGLNTFVLYIRESAPSPHGAVPLGRRILAEPGFRLVYFDDAYVVCVRETDETRKWLSERALRFVHPFDVGRLYPALDDPGRRPVAEAEIARLREQSGDAARVLLIASMAAKHMAKYREADELMKEATRKNPALSVKKE